MTADWDLLGDRPRPENLPHRSGLTSCGGLSALPTDDAERVAVLAAVVARYTGRERVELGWSDGGPWRRIDLVVDMEATFPRLVVAAGDALGGAPRGDVPGVGIGRADAPRDGAPGLLAVAGTTMRYDAALYDVADALRFAGHLRTLSAARHRNVSLGRLPLLGADERAALQAGNARPPLPSDGRALPSLIGEQARRRPDEIAVRTAHQQVTYGQLWRRSGALAAHLRPRSLIGVWADRTVDMVVGLVAVLRAGAAYVALEPSYPAARVIAVIQAAGLDTVVGPPEAARLLGGTAGVVPVRGHPDVAFPDGRAHPDDLAYVMFTSGSTGRPKGVAVEHRSVANLLAHMAGSPGLGAGEAMLGVTTPAFDLSVPDLFLPLVTGATLYLADPEDTRDGQRLAALIARARPGLMQATPSTWRLLLTAGWAGAPQLRVVCGGEGYDAALASALGSRVAGVWNFYGPTETTVWSVSTRLAGDTADPLPIGRPVRGTACYVLDERGQLVPPGVRGELHIAGAGLARGYLGDPDATAAAFVPCRFPAAPSDRMYRTGDLVRESPAGELTFAGRRDLQVKLNGFRIELGEVEVAASTVPGVIQAVAAIRSAETGPRLVCYVTGSGLDPRSVRATLATVLPPQTVPSTVVVLDAIPLNGNGKVDRALLPEPPGRTGLPLSGPFEHMLADLWREVLDTREVFADDDLFALGADSLDVGRIAIRLATRLAVDVPPADVFRYPVLRDLAGALFERVLAVDTGALTAVESR